MNVIDLEHGLIGCYGIVGGSIAAGLGASLSAKRQGRVSRRLLRRRRREPGLLPRMPEHGQGPLASAVFVCENNFYAEFTPLADATAGADIAGPRARL